MPVVIRAAVAMVMMFAGEHFFVIVFHVFVTALLAVMIEIVRAYQTQASEDRDEGLPEMA